LEKPVKGPGFSLKSKEAVPKTEVLEQPLFIQKIYKCNRLLEVPGKPQYTGIYWIVLLKIMRRGIILTALLIAGGLLWGEIPGENPPGTGPRPVWYISLRDAVYDQNLTIEAMEALYREALAGAESGLTGQAKSLMLARCEYLMGRAYQDKDNKKNAGVHYDKGILWAEAAQEQGETSEGWLLLAQNIAQNCNVKPVSWVMANGLKVERYSKNALALNPRNVTALYMIAARYAFAPRPFGNYPKGVQMMREILAANEPVMERDELFNVYSAVGYAYIQDKKQEEARPWLEKSLTYYPGNKFVRGLLNN
jgi:tetratricopeptide (TPR) repeat protein